MEELHKPVLLSEVLEVLEPKIGESYMDLTAGYAGHASKILDVTQNYKDSVLVDRDEFAAEYLADKFINEMKNKYSELSEEDCKKIKERFLNIMSEIGNNLDNPPKSFKVPKEKNESKSSAIKNNPQLTEKENLIQNNEEILSQNNKSNEEQKTEDKQTAHIC